MNEGQPVTPLQARLEITLHDICEALKEEEAKDLLILLVSKLIKELGPVLVVVLHELIAKGGGPQVLLLAGDLLTNHKVDG